MWLCWILGHKFISQMKKDDGSMFVHQWGYCLRCGTPTPQQDITNDKKGK